MVKPTFLCRTGSPPSLTEHTDHFWSADSCSKPEVWLRGALCYSRHSSASPQGWLAQELSGGGVTCPLQAELRHREGTIYHAATDFGKVKKF